MRRLVHVDILAVFFGLGTWLCVNGLWVELPLLVMRLPEAWKLPSYLSVVIQIANLGPLSYTLLNSFFPAQVTEKRSIYFVMILGLATTLLLPHFWEKTTFVGGVEHSTAFLALVFFLACVDTSSRVLYFPFMSKFQGHFFISYFIGEGMSGFLPSILALVQGVGGNPECRNGTDGTVYPYTYPPRFSVNMFFYLLFAFTLASLVAFFLLNKESIVEGALVDDPRNSTISSSSKSSYGSAEVSVFEPPGTENELTEADGLKSPEVPVIGITHSTFVSLLMLQAFVCFLAFGVFPSVQSYSCLPYGNVAYHLSVTLSNMMNPLVCFLAFFMPKGGTRSVITATVGSLVVSAYLLYTALESPSPPWVGTRGGEFVLILGWILLVGLTTYVRLTVATMLKEMGKSGLLWCGAVTQIGASLGALSAFFAVNYSDLFVAYYPCA